MGFLAKRREHRRLSKIGEEIVAQYHEDVRVSDAAAERQSRLIAAESERIAQSPLDVYFKGCLAGCLLAGGIALAKLQGVTAGLDFDHEASEALRSAVRTVEVDDDERWWRACSLVRWGYSAAVIATNWLDSYEEIADIAKIAVPIDAAPDAEVLNAGTFSISDPQGFSTLLVARLADLLADGGPQASDFAQELAIFWPPCREEGWVMFHLQMRKWFPEGPPEDE